MKESVLSFACEGEPLVGILAEPEGAAAEVGVIIIVGGPQYRAGSHRQFTLLARHLAANGFVALRFDYRSMGDSPGDMRDCLGVDADIGAAIGALLAARPGLKCVALWGLCDAASAALLYVDSRRDMRVVGLALANPWVRTETSLAQAHLKHYYWQRLRQPEFWHKLLGGGVGLRALRGLGANLRRATGSSRQKPNNDLNRSFQDRMLQGLQSFYGPVLLLLSGDDYTAKEFLQTCQSSPPWAGTLVRDTLQRVDFPNADHTHSKPGEVDQVNEATLAWLQSALKAS